MNEYTPGPWTVPHFANEQHVCNCAYVLSESQYGWGAIATVHHQGEDDGQHNEPHDIAVANARLIAAAPDMLTALEFFVKEYVQLVESGDAGFWDAEEEDKVIMARKAIAKARNGGNNE